MPFKLSRCINLQHPARDHIATFYENILGFEIARDDTGAFEIKNGPIRFFLDKGEPRELILELIVPELETARDELIRAGCRVIRWEGKGKCCYIRDPFGQLYNLWEDAEAFST
jgi:catechol 2,3-dioxygenase-like lactoylglutathione lyase family enzyme